MAPAGGRSSAWISPVAGLVIAVGASVALFGAQRPPSAFPVVVDNCGVSISYAGPPRRAVTMNQGATEIMLALGLQDRMIGTAFLDEGVSPALASAYKQVPVLARTYPSREVLLAARPDFVYGSYDSAFSERAAGSRTDLARMRVSSYVSRPGCATRYRPAKATLDSTFAEIREVARIFGAVPRAEQLIASYQAELADVQRRIGSIAKPRRIFWYDAGDPPRAGACCGMPNEIMRLVGAENVFATTPGVWTEVSWESVVAANPDTIVVIESRFPAAEKRQLLLGRKAFASIDAVRHQRFITINFGDSTPGIRNVAAVTALAKALYPDKFKTP